MWGAYIRSEISKVSHKGPESNYFSLSGLCCTLLFFKPLKNVKIILSSRPSKNSQQARFGLGATVFGKPCSRVQKTLHQAAFWNPLSRLLRANAVSNRAGNPAPGSPARSLPEPTPSVARLSRCFLLSISPSVPGGPPPSPRAQQNASCWLFGRKCSVRVQKPIRAEVMCLACLNNQGERFDFSGCHS